MKEITEASIRRFLLDKYREPIGALGLIPEELADDFDFLLSGVIDSFGILEMISAGRGRVSDTAGLGNIGHRTYYDPWAAVSVCGRKCKGHQQLKIRRF
jgi:hypothetical protein